MVRAAERGTNSVPSSLASVERTLERVIECLANGAHTREARALLIEARRLRNVVANWRSIPPSPDVHDEMLERVMELSTAVGIAFLDAAGKLREEPEPESYPQITGGDAKEADQDDADAYSLDFEPHLYSLEGETSARRQAIPPPAPPQRPEPTTGLRGASQPRPQAAPFVTAHDNPYVAIVSGSAAMRPSSVPPAWSPAPSISMPVLEDEGAPPHLVVTRSPAPPSDEPPPTQPRHRQRPTSDSPPLPQPSPTAPKPVSAPPQPEPITRPSYRPPVTTRRASGPPPPLQEDWLVDPGLPGPLPGDLGLDPAEGEPLGVPRTAVTAVAVTMGDPVDPLLVFLNEPYSPRADAYRAVRRKLTSSGNPRVIGVTSAHKGEGKTTLAVNLALTLREGGRGQVLLIEANLVAPSFTRLFGFPPPVCFLLQLSRHLEDPRAPWIAAEPMARLHVMGIDATLKHPPLLDSVAFSAGMERLLQAGYEDLKQSDTRKCGGKNCGKQLVGIQVRR